MNYFWHLVIYISIYWIIANGLSLLVGFCGRLSVAHAAFFCIGAYAYGLLALNGGAAFMPSLAMGALIAAVASLMISLPASRFRGDIFIILSIAAQTVIASILYNWTSFTNGPSGILNIPRPTLPWIRFETSAEYALLSVTLACGVALLTRKWMLSPWGRLLKAVRDDRVVVAGLGKDPKRVEQQAFAISCAIGAVAGVLYAGYATFIEPSAASLDHSILMLSMVLIGGAGTFQGAVIGAAMLILFPELLRLIDIPGPVAANVRLFVYGALLVSLVHFRPPIKHIKAVVSKFYDVSEAPWSGVLWNSTTRKMNVTVAAEKLARRLWRYLLGLDEDKAKLTHDWRAMVEPGNDATTIKLPTPPKAM